MDIGELCHNVVAPMVPTASDSACSEPAASSEIREGNDGDDDDDDDDDDADKTILSTMMANVNDLLIVSYNMRSYFQGIKGD